MKKNKWNTYDALKFVIEKRKIFPNQSFLKQLLELEYEIFGKETMTIDELWEKYLKL